MYFKSFVLGTNTQKQIERAGFTIHSWKTVKAFYRDEEISNSACPKDFFFDGSIWEPIDVSSTYERLLLLARLPMLPFIELWNLFLRNNKDDSFGALVIISQKYLVNLIDELEHNRFNYQNSKKHHKKLSELKNHSLILHSSKSNQIAEILNTILENQPYR